ncbi:hypothetical protein RUM44_011606 [Polyplax serrata]|uniref:CREB-regulated transcription coactivator 1 n=1 Tax=Polyplax serrata TaxID=468196 RepID=A0ABR1AQH8_POLSC
MANPRKFSEKIALHNQKQAEETARFEQIMREVSDATNKMNSLAKQHLHISPTLGSFRGGSLPNVNHVASNTVENKVGLQILSLTTDRPNASHLEELNKSGRADAQVVYRDRGRSVGVGPMRSRPIEKRIDTSPYGGAYLSPPPDTNWRRTNSDSALHQSTQDVGQRRQHHDSQILGISFNDKTSEQRPRSCYEDSLVPGINIHPSHNEPGTVQIPIGNNTGSLPDLTSFHFPSPLPTPLDQEDPSSSFSTSPQGTSPCTLSPSLSLRSRPLEKFPFGASSPQESRVPSPHSNIHPQVQNRQIHSSTQRQFYTTSPRLQNLTVGPPSPGGSHSPTQNSSLQGVTQDHSATISVDNYSQPKFVYQNSPLSPTLVNCSLSPPSDLSPQQSQTPQQQINTLNTYRNPTPNRPSPQNSPGLSIQQYRSTSPGDSHNSAPPSPASPVGSPGANTFTESNYFISHAQQAAALQQHFEQFNMVSSSFSKLMKCGDREHAGLVSLPFSSV